MRDRAPRAWALIYRKELKDTLRDRRTLTTMLLVPMVLYPLALVFGSEAMLPKDEPLVVRVAAIPPLPSEVAAALNSKTISYRGVEPEGEERAQAEQLLARHDVVLASTATGAQAWAGLGTLALRLYFDESRPRAHAQKDQVEEVLRGVAEENTVRRLAAHGLPPSAITPMTLRAHSVAKKERSGNRMLGLILPTLVLTFIAISCFYPAVDLTAGEKERKTLATLLSAPVPIRDIVFGKYLAVLTVGSLAGLLNVTVLGATVYRLMLSSPKGDGLAFDLSPLLVIGLLLGVVAIAAPVAALMLGAASLARSFRDASTLLTPVLLLVLLPLGLTMSPDTRLNFQWAAVPLAGAALLLRALLHEEATLSQLVLVLASAAAITALLLFVVARLFADERALFSTEGRRADLRSVLFAPPSLSPATAAALAGTIFVVHYYAGALSSWWPAVIAVPITQVLAQVVPAGLLARWLRHQLPPRDFLALGPPSWRGWMAALFLGAGAWLGLSLPAAWLADFLFGDLSAVARDLSAELGLAELGPVSMVLAFALTPAICEELAFRGAIYGLLIGRTTVRSAVVLQALAFGAMHGSVHRFLPTTLLGLALGLLRAKTGSVWPGILVHALTNATLLLLDRAYGESGLFGSPTPVAFLGLLGVGWAFVLLRGTPLNNSSHQSDRPGVTPTESPRGNEG